LGVKLCSGSKKVSGGDGTEFWAPCVASR